MTYPDEPIFDDPALKAALVRSFPPIPTPPHLRARIALVLQNADAIPSTAPMLVPLTRLNASNGVSDPIPSSVMRINPQTMTANGWSMVLPGMAIAASMLITIGLMVFFLSGSAQAVPEKFEAAAIARHDECCTSRDHHLPAIRTASYPEIGRYLQQELEHPVLAADLTHDGWQFSGAAICPIGGVLTAHLLFRKGSDTISVFSLPKSALPTLSQHQSYQGATADGHSVIVRAEDGALFCLVGHGDPANLNVDQLDGLFDKHHSEATVAATPGPRISVAGIERER